MTPPSKSRGLLFYGFCCGKNKPWQPNHKTWQEVYREKVGWPDKPEVPKHESKEEALIRWAAEDFGNFYNMGVELRYLEALGEWFVVGEVFLGSDILPHEITRDLSAGKNHNDSIANFCQVMGIEYTLPQWYLTSIPFDKELRTRNQTNGS